MHLPTEIHPYAGTATERDTDERHFATAPVEEIRRELRQFDIHVEPTVAMLQAFIEKQTVPAKVVGPEGTYLQHLESIERIAAFVARRACASADDTAEFTQVVRVKLFEDDYAIIRKFEGRSSFTTYLTTVTLRLFQQWRAGIWGKWRPSQAARMLGEKAITLERLITRDGFSISEAVAILTLRKPAVYTVAELEAIYVRLPLRKPRPVLLADEDVLLDLPGAGSAEERVCASERENEARAAAAALDRAIRDCSAEDRLILQMRFWNQKKVPEIARLLGHEQRAIYTRLAQLFKVLRRALESSGIDAATVSGLIDGPMLDLVLKSLPEDTQTTTATPESAADRTSA